MLRVILPLLIAGATIVGCRMMVESGEDPAKRLDNAIAAEVPTAATRPQVEAWLDQRGIVHSFSVDTTQDKFGTQTMPMLAGLRDDELGGMVVGTIHCPSATLQTRNSGLLSIYFFLDRRGVCVDHFVHWFEYSL